MTTDETLMVSIFLKNDRVWTVDRADADRKMVVISRDENFHRK